MSIKKAVVVVAGGKGLRMQTEMPKQFIEINGLPILMHTILKFHSFDPEMQLVLVLPAQHLNFWNSLCERYDFGIKHTVVVGGETRFQSVCNGLLQLLDVDLVAVHDGVRPLVSHATIDRCFKGALQAGTAIPVIDCVESLREVKQGSSCAVDRSCYKLVQTPQVFETQLLLKAYEQAFSPLFTDDASVVERYFEQQTHTVNRQIALVEGNRENIKITTQFDLKIAEAVLPKFEWKAQ